MRKIDLDNFQKPYENSSVESFDNRFYSAIGADIPSAEKLANEILNDLDTNTFGINWWTNLPVQERILIGDYLYQCATSIETNIVEAKLHLLEWIDSNEKNSEYTSALLTNKTFPQSPIEELYRKLEELHVCGFFRAIGSSLDCVGALIIGILALPLRKQKSLRKSDIKMAEEALSDISDSGGMKTELQLEFRDFFSQAKLSVGPTDWLEWSDQNRNMYVHRGRRIIQSTVTPRKPILYDARGQEILRFKSTMHLAKYPDRSDAEAFIKGADVNLSENAEDTLKGVFKSCRNLIEILTEKLLSIWQVRRNDPSILEQPEKHWDSKIKSCNFNGYDKNILNKKKDVAFVSPILSKRMLSAAALDHQRILWSNSRWI